MRFGFVRLRLFTELLSVRVFFSVNAPQVAVRLTGACTEKLVESQQELRALIDKCVLRVFSLHAHGVATAVDTSDLVPIEQKSAQRITRVRAGPNQPAWRIIVSAMSCWSPAMQE